MFRDSRLRRRLSDDPADGSCRSAHARSRGMLEHGRHRRRNRNRIRPCARSAGVRRQQRRRNSRDAILRADSSRPRGRRRGGSCGRSPSKARPIQPADSLCRYLQLRSRGDARKLSGWNCPASPIAGGGASEDGSIGETFVFCGDTISSNAVSGMLLAGDFDLTLANTIACGLIGTAHRVTAARDNILIELDGRPAYEVFAEAAGPLAADLRRALAYVFVAISVYENATRSSAANSSCAISSAPARSTASSQSAFQPKIGDTIGFVLRDAERSREDLKATLDEVNNRLDAAARLRPLLRLRLARRRPLQHPGSRLRLHQTRARPDPDRRLLHRLRNRRARRSNLRCSNTPASSH